MTKQIEISREELYARVWETPTRKLAAEFGLADVGLAKVCKRYDIPTPRLATGRSGDTVGGSREPPRQAIRDRLALEDYGGRLLVRRLTGLG